MLRVQKGGAPPCEKNSHLRLPHGRLAFNIESGGAGGAPAWGCASLRMAVFSHRPEWERPNLVVLGVQKIKLTSEKTSSTCCSASIRLEGVPASACVFAATCICVCDGATFVSIGPWFPLRLWATCASRSRVSPTSKARRILGIQGRHGLEFQNIAQFWPALRASQRRLQHCSTCGEFSRRVCFV